MTTWGMHPLPGRTKEAAWVAVPQGCTNCRYRWRRGLVHQCCTRCSPGCAKGAADPERIYLVYGIHAYNRLRVRAVVGGYK